MIRATVCYGLKERLLRCLRLNNYEPIWTSTSPTEFSAFFNSTMSIDLLDRMIRKDIPGAWLEVREVPDEEV